MRAGLAACAVALGLVGLSACRRPPAPAATKDPGPPAPSAAPVVDPLVARARAYLADRAIEPWPAARGFALWRALHDAGTDWRAELALLTRLAQLGSALTPWLGDLVWTAGWRAAAAAPASERARRRHEVVLAWAEALHNDERFDAAAALLAAQRCAADDPYHLLFALRAMLCAYERGDDGATQTHLEQAERVLATTTRPDAAAWARTVFAIYHGHLQLRQGFLDRAAHAFAEAGSSPVNDLAMAMASGRMHAAAGLLDPAHAAVADPGAQLRLRLSACMVHRRLHSPAAELRAELAAIAASPLATAATHRALAIEAADLALDHGDVAGAARLLGPALAFARGTRFRGQSGVSAALVWARLALARAGTDDDVQEQLRACRATLLDAWRQQLSRWQVLPLRRGGVAFLQYSVRRDLLSTLISLELRLDDEAGVSAALAHVLAAEACDSLARRMRASTDAAVTSTEVVDLVPEDGGLLVYVPALRGSHLFACRATDVTHFELGADVELDRSVRDLLVALRTGAEAQPIAERAQTVDAWVLPAAVRAHVAGWHTLGVVGRELLSKAPFEVLTDGSATLAQTRALYYLPSLTVGVHLLRRQTTRAPAADAPTDASTAATALVATAFDPDLRAQYGIEPLRVSDGERHELASVHGLTCRLDAAASVAALRELRDQTALYLVAHGVQNAAWERPAGLALADCLLSCDDIEAMTVPPRVLLFACGAGRATQRRGDTSGHHLGGAFLLAGAPVVGLSDDDVELGQSLALLRDVQRARAEGCAMSEALRRARGHMPARTGIGVRLLRLEGLADRF